MLRFVLICYASYNMLRFVLICYNSCATTGSSLPFKSFFTFESLTILCGCDSIQDKISLTKNFLKRTKLPWPIFFKNNVAAPRRVDSFREARWPTVPASQPLHDSRHMTGAIRTGSSVSVAPCRSSRCRRTHARTHAHAHAWSWQTPKRVVGELESRVVMQVARWQCFE